MTGMPGGCARAASGHDAAAPPTRPKKFRYLIPRPLAQEQASHRLELAL